MNANKEKIMNLEFTGERLVPDKVSPEDQIFIEHISRYLFVQDYIKDKTVLDIGCGCGYGLHLLSGSIKEGVGIDIAKDAIDYCKNRYNDKNINYKIMDGRRPLFEPESFDVIISFEFIEHINEHAEFMNNVCRLLKRDGILIISTPNKPVYNFNKPEKNVFHEKELNYDEFRKILESQFHTVKIVGQSVDPQYSVRQKLHYLNTQILRINKQIDHLPLTLMKSLVPRTLKALIKKVLVAQPPGKKFEVRDIDFKHLIENVDFSEDQIDKSMYFIGICSSKN